VVKNRVKELLAIKERDENRKISEALLAEETGLSESTVRAWLENRVARFDSNPIIQFCWYFNIGPGELFVIPEKPEAEINPKSSQDVPAVPVAA
jgi:hypothetical protein